MTYRSCDIYHFDPESSNKSSKRKSTLKDGAEIQEYRQRYLARDDCKRDIAYCKRPKTAIRGDKQLGGGQSEFSPSTSEVIGFAHFPLSINSCLSTFKARVTSKCCTWEAEFKATGRSSLLSGALVCLRRRTIKSFYSRHLYGDPIWRSEL